MDIAGQLSPARLDWFSRAYLVDWIVTAFIHALSWLVSYSSVFERDFTPDDPLISHPHKKNQIGGGLNYLLALFLPMGCIVSIGLLRKSTLEVHHGAVSVLTSVGLAQLVTRFMKHRIGRLRPDFLARCKWDVKHKICTGKADTILNGRLSFPSGHSSTAFSGFALLSLWIAGQTAAWCFGKPLASHSWHSTKLGRFILTLLPLAWALFVAMSRLSDYRHHEEDVIVGSLIGIVTSTISYLIFWPNPFTRATYARRRTSAPNLLYVEEDENMDASHFELAPMHDDGPDNV